LKVLYSLNLIASYAISIYPCNAILEEWILKCFDSKKQIDDLDETEEEKKKREVQE